MNVYHYNSFPICPENVNALIFYTKAGILNISVYSHIYPLFGIYNGSEIKIERIHYYNKTVTFVYFKKKYE